MSARPGLAPSHDRRPPRAGVGVSRDGLPALDDARRDAAREAWRQFARAAGARKHGRRPSNNRGPTLALLVAIAVGSVVWLWRELTEPAPSSPIALAEEPRQNSVPDPMPRSVVEPEPSDVLDDPVVAQEESRAPALTPQAPREPSPPPANPRLQPRTETQSRSSGWTGVKNPRTAPPGTSEANAEALRKLPVARADKPPVGGVGVLGIHVDDIQVGSLYDSGRCSGHETGFSALRNDRVSVCFRIVHPRTTQQVTVLWQRGDEIMRRTKITIPAAHAYRTRAFIVLRDGDAGKWTVRVLSSDDVELALARFDVSAG